MRKLVLGEKIFNNLSVFRYMVIISIFIAGIPIKSSLSKEDSGVQPLSSAWDGQNLWCEDNQFEMDIKFSKNTYKIEITNQRSDPRGSGDCKGSISDTGKLEESPCDLFDYAVRSILGYVDSVTEL